MLEVIYIVRHGYRSNWAVDPQTGTYSSTVRTPTGIPSDPALASYGVRQSQQLATHLLSLDPCPDVLYSSPYYRCLQTLAPYVDQLAEQKREQGVRVTIEPGVGEFYGEARFEHPSPAGLEELNKHFPHLHAEVEPTIVPAKNGESITNLHDRVAYCLDALIARADKDPQQPKAILICTHAAAIIAMGRCLTGRMPEEIGEEDFRCFTCGVSTFQRRPRNESEESEVREKWSPSQPSKIPDLSWRDGRGVQGGWECEKDSDCSFLENGEERGWNFYMGQQRIERLEAEVAVAAETTQTEAEEAAAAHSGIV
ncbi:C6 zinc cluster transcription factor-like protein [Vermiconidia calcicola]|uniref:C6 zinc cluster transcription factor-like protein n=1 Tax=Vermiconidia calcicola TaxID=1690605 RepID=A0ACC3NY00_9PEZI|nr:C6 zinc cluster transcription factor-like protein [Vermiconidia calcicola]